MKIVTTKIDQADMYKIICSNCNRELATFIVYVENGLVDPVAELERFRKTHKCLED